MYREPYSDKHLPLYSGETEGVFLVIPKIYYGSGYLYIRENSSYASIGDPIYKIRFRLKGKAK
jgi:hypothetical protein